MDAVWEIQSNLNLRKMGNKKVFYLEFLVKMSKVRFSSKISKEGFNRKMKKKLFGIFQKVLLSPTLWSKKQSEIFQGEVSQKVGKFQYFFLSFFFEPFPGRFQK